MRLPSGTKQLRIGAATEAAVAAATVAATIAAAAIKAHLGCHKSSNNDPPRRVWRSCSRVVAAAVVAVHIFLSAASSRAALVQCLLQPSKLQTLLHQLVAAVVILLR